MNALLLLLTWLAPIAALPAVYSRWGRWLPAIAALPALAAALLVTPDASVRIPWLLMGTQLGLDDTSRMFLLSGSLLWLIAGFYAASYMRDDAHAGRFNCFYLLAMSGNFGLIVGQDLMSFYVGFGLMGLAAYGLVVHDGTPSVRRAGRVYLVMTLIGELLLFAAFVSMYQRTGSLVPTPEQLARGLGMTEVALLSSAFGIKAGLVGLHVWLPLAHPAAPVPASAVLSGVMIKSALVGWIRYLPLGVVALPEVGGVLIAAGVATAVLAIPLGVGQRDAKVVLAYSSIGKMGTMVAGIGFAALEPALATPLIAAIAFYAAHHALAKGALFLGVGVVKYRAGSWPLLTLAVPALVLAGAPFTSGAVAKAQLKQGLASAPPFWESLFAIAAPVTLAGTVLLMARFLYLNWRARDASSTTLQGMDISWIALVALSLALPLTRGEAAWEWSDAVILLLVALGALWVARKLPPWLTGCVGRIPPGDLVELSRLLPRGVFQRAGEPALRGKAGITHRLASLLTGADIESTASAGASASAKPGLALAGLLWLCVLAALLLAMLLAG